MTELNKVSKNLLSRKCKDPDDFVYDLFKDGAIGLDLRESVLFCSVPIAINIVLMLVNRMKV